MSAVLSRLKIFILRNGEFFLILSILSKYFCIFIFIAYAAALLLFHRLLYPAKRPMVKNRAAEGEGKIALDFFKKFNIAD